MIYIWEKSNNIIFIKGFFMEIWWNNFMGILKFFFVEISFCKYKCWFMNIKKSLE